MDQRVETGEVVHKALKYAVDIIHPGMPILELCQRIEEYILAQGARPAFPVNIGVNEVAAHYTAVRGDKSAIPNSAVVKMDVGAHRGGHIVDAAVTVSLGTNAYDGVIKAAYNALRAAYESLRQGVKAWQIGEVIESKIKSAGYRPIYNLTGHRIEPFNLHAGDVIPNYGDKSASQTLKAGDVYAIEPFATNGRGYVVERNQITIYKLIRIKYKKRQDYIDRIYREANYLPFTPRWFPDIPDDFFVEARAAGALHGYEVLVEEAGGVVAQFEDTFVVEEDGARPLSRTLDLY